MDKYNLIKNRIGTHFLPLDGIRGIAILLVMAEHLFLFTPDHSWQKPFSWVVSTGWIGVDLFFVLSGFLITGILYEARESSHYFRNFYMRRVLRIFPLNYLYIGVFTLAALYLAKHGSGAATAKANQALKELPWVWLYSTNILIAKTGAFITASLNIFWSLAIEEQFYFIWPAFIFFLDRSKLLKMCGVFFLASILFRIAVIATCANYEIINHVLTISRFDQFAFGGIAALLMRGSSDSIHKVNRWNPYLLFSSFALILLAETLKQGFATDIGMVNAAEYSFSALFFASVIWWVFSAPQSSLSYRFSSLSIFRVFGKYSYALYIFHYPLWIASNWILWARLGSNPLFQSSEFGPAIFRGLVIGLMALFLSWMSWNLFEKPILSLKKYFSY